MVHLNVTISTSFISRFLPFIRHFIHVTCPPIHLCIYRVGDGENSPQEEEGGRRCGVGKGNRVRRGVRPARVREGEASDAV
jgi:hypothetical protein